MYTPFIFTVSSVVQIVLSPKRLDNLLDSLGYIRPNDLKLFEFIDLVQLTIPIPDFNLKSQAVLKNPDLERDPNYFMSMLDLLNSVDSQNMRSVMLETGNVLSTQLHEMKKQGEKCSLLSTISQAL
ncbi:hypothetical protein BLNAU_12781 [Blattamonas nauphoetae]|uniref:Uncharacterized protein n=1 Tax=Blattamonas nauphoetae TaxID=2049346 RepID=A0ABQ9XII2_9EUKA|nr:hypothetical protein BLNAU_12781 [Blattamonas nauphoetae]